VLDALNSSKILAYIDSIGQQRLSKLHIFDTISSTNSYLLQLIPAIFTESHVCLADEQTAGRGRLGRRWYSPSGANLYCSLSWPTQATQQLRPALSLAVAVIVVKAIERCIGPNKITLKWPNDILFDGRKLAGILIEQNQNASVIGIGLNIAFPPDQVTDAWIDLQEIAQTPISRNQLAGVLINELLIHLPIFMSEGFSYFIQAWREYDGFTATNISIVTPTETYLGIMQGINELGQLILKEATGELRYFDTGEVSMRPANR
jgi:BirA family biotin operon repressor/biotin-[acetyl-CoA-carboxylase] ligase